MRPGDADHGVAVIDGAGLTLRQAESSVVQIAERRTKNSRMLIAAGGGGTRRPNHFSVHTDAVSVTEGNFVVRRRHADYTGRAAAPLDRAGLQETVERRED